MENELKLIDVQQVSKSSNTFLYTLLSLILVLTGYITYMYSSHDIVKKGDLKEQYVLKTDISFDMLPSYERSKYVEYFEHNNQVTVLKNQLQLLQNNTNTVSTSKPVVIEKIVEVEKVVEVEKIVEKIVKVEKIVEVEKIKEVEKIVTVPMNVEDEVQIVKEFKKSNLTFNTYTCKNMESGGINISQKCKKELYAFLDKNKNSKLYEVIGMVDNKDFKLINKLKDVYGEKRIKHLSKYSQIGLSRQRVIEASWLVKKHIGNYKYIKTVNYTVNAKDKKGFVVRAYK